jgi:dienelactone hydrolase
MGGALSLSFAAKMATTKVTPLNAAVSFYGVPQAINADLASLPKKTPVLACFGALDSLKGFSDSETVAKLAQAWYSHGLNEKEHSD